MSPGYAKRLFFLLLSITISGNLAEPSSAEKENAAKKEHPTTPPYTDPPPSLEFPRVGGSASHINNRIIRNNII